MKSGLHVCFGVASFVVLAACRAPDNSAPAIDQSLEITVERRFDAQVDPLSAVGPIALTADGRFAVIDHANATVLEFDASAKPVGSLGRKGSGPGELLAPVAVAIAQNGTVAVSDIANGRISYWGWDGKYLGMTPVAEPVPELTFQDPSGVLHAGSESGHGRAILTSDGPPIDDEHLQVLSRRPLAMQGNGAPAEGPCLSCGFSLTRDGALLEYGDNTSYAVIVADLEGVERGRIQVRGIAPIPRDQVSLARLAHSLPGASRGDLDKLPAAWRYVPTVLAARRDSTGAIWVLRGSLDGETTRVDKFAPAGTPIGFVTLPGRVRWFDIRDGKRMAISGVSPAGTPIVSLLYLHTS